MLDHIYTKYTMTKRQDTRGPWPWFGGARSLIIYQAGVDGLKGDRFGRFALTRQGLQARNAFVYSLACETQTPLLITMGGGYHKDIQETVRASADVYLQAAEVWAKCQKGPKHMHCM